MASVRMHPLYLRLYHSPTKPVPHLAFDSCRSPPLQLQLPFGHIFRLTHSATLSCPLCLVLWHLHLSLSTTGLQPHVLGACVLWPRANAMLFVHQCLVP